jgi:hypothetical protein
MFSGSFEEGTILPIMDFGEVLIRTLSGICLHFVAVFTK